MSRRSTFERIDQARRAAVRARLIGEALYDRPCIPYPARRTQ
jgi:hypothetical protein